MKDGFVCSKKITRRVKKSNLTETKFGLVLIPWKAIQKIEKFVEINIALQIISKNYILKNLFILFHPVPKILISQ